MLILENFQDIYKIDRQIETAIQKSSKESLNTKGIKKALWKTNRFL
jgi:hypothetical protein